MPLVAVLIFVVVSFAFTGLPGMPGLAERMNSSHLEIPKYAFMAPERKSILVDPEGEAHPTADRTHPTKRDRSRKIRIEPVRYEDRTPAPELNVPPPQPEQAPSYERTQPDLRPVTKPMSAGRRVKRDVMMDPSISHFTRMTIGVSSEQGRVALKGFVMDEQERQRILTIAARTVSPDRIDDRLKILNE